MSYIYAMRVPGFLKIGVAINIAKRMKQLQTGQPHPLQLVGYCYGGQPLEAQIHAALSEYRAHGEWFIDAPALPGICRGLGLHIADDSILPPDPRCKWQHCPSDRRIADDESAAELWLSYHIARVLTPHPRASGPKDSMWQDSAYQRHIHATWWKVGSSLVRARCSFYSSPALHEPTIWRVSFERDNYQRGGEWSCLPSELAAVGSTMAEYLRACQQTGELVSHYEWTDAARSLYDNDVLPKRLAREARRRQRAAQ